MKNPPSNITRAKFDFINSAVIEKLESYNPQADQELESIPKQEPYSLNGQKLRLNFIQKQLGTNTDYLSGEKTFSDNESLKGNIENYIGMSQIPTGIVGPLVINGTHAQGGFYVPLATTEGALLASYNRGAKACKESGAITVITLQQGVQRTPTFKFKNLIDLGKFAAWIMNHTETFSLLTKETSNYAVLNDLNINIEGNILILRLEYTSGDASGQNMVTICSDKICQYILENCPVKPVFWTIEGNYSGDKKTGPINTRARGRKITAEIVIKKEIVKSVLKTTPTLLLEQWKICVSGAQKAGVVGSGMHPSNGLAALFIACGQDVACTGEASIATTRMEINENNDVYFAITMSNIIVGTVGGGTSFPTQKECLQLMDCYGPGKSGKFAEIAIALCLTGELSILAAMSSGQFTTAHQTLGR
ncbi:hydroxymethylglutaryl-CoA reductase [Flavobacterium branchiicola]|uniref:hydroxymethylglutaryl-CoA reductase (NADPH) n=1 Tax=Flavobacterium branchiicola TaxID=1114875 RepID=A0ABV9PG36_9FLAO|nr:hydroxymethylglutaryl-CoA reductase [Flavobacterium branchiicola]MBS7255519.1 hydroxymethylglutaryl-CoA reductase [Flavobacterium branchiicola]